MNISNRSRPFTFNRVRHVVHMKVSVDLSEPQIMSVDEWGAGYNPLNEG
jgi:hypothetical protein